MIELVVAELERELARAGVRGRAGRRAAAEARGHLLDAARRDGEAAAVAAFGRPDELAGAIAGELATSRTRVAAYRTFASLAAVGTLFVAAWLSGPARGRLELGSGDPGELATAATLGLLLAPQIAFAAGCLALARAWRLGDRGVLSAGELRVQRRRCVVALAAGAVTLVCLCALALADPTELPGWWAVAVLVGGLLLSPVLVHAGMLIAGAARPAAPPGAVAGDALDDLAVLLPPIVPVQRLGLAGHPWRFAGLVAALAAGVVLLAGVAGSDSLDAVLQAGAEALAVLGCFGLFGKYLALRVP